MGAVVSCERSHWGLWWSSLWGHDPREGCAQMLMLMLMMIVVVMMMVVATMMMIMEVRAR